MNQIEIIDEFADIRCGSLEPRAFMDDVLHRLGVDNWSLSLVLTGNKQIQENNRAWRNIDEPTDILTFSQCEGMEIPGGENSLHNIEAGDIMISKERVMEQSQELNRPFEEELRRVIIHGILHLKGMDHPGDDYEGSMLKLQERLVQETGCLTAKTK